LNIGGGLVLVRFASRTVSSRCLVAMPVVCTYCLRQSLPVDLPRARFEPIVSGMGNFSSAGKQGQNCPDPGFLAHT